MYLQALSGSSIGLLLGILMGLSASPVTALVVGAIAALLASLVLPQPKAATEAGPARHRDASIRASALSIAAIVGITAGLWIRTHDLLSPAKPSLKSQVDALTSAGYSADEARRLVASKEFPGAQPAGPPLKPAQEGQQPKSSEGSSSSPSRPATATAAPEKVKSPDTRSSALFGLDVSTCEQISPTRFATTAAAANAYEAAGHERLARIARGLVRSIPDEQMRHESLMTFVGGLCADVR